MQFSTLTIFTVLLAAGTSLAAPARGGGRRFRGKFRGKKTTSCTTVPTVATTVALLPIVSTEPVVVETTTAPTVQDVVVVEATTTVQAAAPPTVAPAPAPAPVTTTQAPAPAPTTAPVTSGLTADQQAALDKHNAARAEVGQAALAWDAGLAADALAWAQHLTTVGSLEHSTNGQRPNQGENLFWQSNSISNPLEVGSNAWISEKNLYTPGQAIGTGDFGSYGHYTQIVWKDTTHVGVAAATDSKGGVYVVARYSPPGNFVGQAAY